MLKRATCPTYEGADVAMEDAAIEILDVKATVPKRKIRQFHVERQNVKHPHLYEALALYCPSISIALRGFFLL